MARDGKCYLWLASYSIQVKVPSLPFHVWNEPIVAQNSDDEPVEQPMERFLAPIDLLDLWKLGVDKCKT